jgi:hypothetical protein
MWRVIVYFVREIDKKPQSFFMDDLTGELEWRLGGFTEEEIRRISIVRAL